MHDHVEDSPSAKLSIHIMGEVSRSQAAAARKEELKTVPALGTLNRFAVLKRLGSGGMGEVYLAEDSLLGRKVALKRVAPKLKANPEYRHRLLKEARQASLLNNAHIAQIYDVVEQGDETLLVMEYVDGVSLRRRLERPLDIQDFLKIAFQCLEALQAAHHQNLLHGDIKPENIMLTPQCQAKILDFGVAKRLPGSGLDTIQTLHATETLHATPAGIEGTPAYMAPELLQGKQADARADIFSLGVVFYEMIGGSHPFQGDTLALTVDRVLHYEPGPLRPANPKVPRVLERIIRRMLAKDPAQRYASAQELLNDFRTFRRAELSAKRKFAILKAAAAILLLACIAFAWSIRSDHSFVRALRQRVLTPHVPAVKQLAILPVSLGGSDPETTAFANGLIQTLTGRLGQLSEQSSLEVIPASETLSRGVATPDQARQEFGANVVLRINVHRAGNMLRVSPVLVDARTHRELRARVVTDSLGNPFTLEDKVADAVLEELGLAVQPQEERKIQSRGTSESGAYDFYLEGLGYLREVQKPESIDSSILLFQRALEKDHGFGLAYAGLGEAYWRKYEHLGQTKWIGQAKEMCDRALGAGNAGTEAYICLGLLSNGQGEYAQAADYYERALDADSGNEQAIVGLAGAYEQLGRSTEAEQLLRKLLERRPWRRLAYNELGKLYHKQGRDAEAAEMYQKYVELAPDAFFGYYSLGAMYVNLGRNAEAIQQLQHSIAIRPTAEAYTNLGTAYFALAKYDEATSAFEQAVKMNGGRYDYWGNLGDAYYWTPGRRTQAGTAYRTAIAVAEQRLQINPRDADATLYIAQYHAMVQQHKPALRYLQRALTLAPHSAEVKFNAAIVHNQLGETDKALAELQQALASGFPANRVDATPNFADLRTNPRFQAIMRAYSHRRGGVNEE